MMIDFLFYLIVCCNFILALDGSYRRCKKKVLIILSPGLQLVLFDLVFYWLHGEPKDTLLIACMQTVLLLSFSLGLRRPFRRKNRTPRPKNLFRSSRFWLDYGASLCIFVTGVSTLAWIFLRSGFPLENVLNFKQFARFYGFSRRAGGATLHLLLFSHAFLLLQLANHSKKLFPFIVSSAFLVILSGTGGRGFIMCGLATNIILFTLHSSKRVTLWTFSLGGIAILGSFIGGSFLRFGGFDFYLNNVIFHDVNMLSTYLEVSQYSFLTQNYLLGFINDVDLLVPSVLVSSKPYSTFETLELFPIVAGYGTNVTIGLYANMLFHLKGLGLFFIAAFYFILGRLYSSLLKDNNRMSLLSLFLTILALSYQVLWLRGGLFNVRIIPVIFCILLSTRVFKGLERLTNG